MAPLPRSSVASRAGASGRLRGTHRPGGSYASELASALLGRNKERALAVLVRAGHDGWDLRDIEELIIVPAVTRLGQLWIRGRLDEASFNQAGALAETVEKAFRSALFHAGPRDPQRRPPLRATR